MDKLIVRGTEINVQWDLKRDDFLSLTDIAKIKDNDNPRYIIQNWLRSCLSFATVPTMYAAKTARDTTADTPVT